MRIYIAGKITGEPDYKEKFAAAAERLRAEGHVPVNPCTVNGEGSRTYKEWIDAGLMKLMGCDAIYMLRDWKHSKGARLEHKYAHVTRMKILKEEDNAPDPTKEA